MMERQKELLPLWAVLTFFAGVFGVVAVIPHRGHTLTLLIPLYQLFYRI